MSNETLFIDNGQLVRLDENTLPTLVAARLNRLVSRALNQSYSSSIIEQCWKDQLRLKSRLKNKRDLIPTIHLSI